MREILFRGKWFGNNEWVEGAFYAYYDFNRTIVQILKDRTNGIPDAYEVYPETVGQYTGLTDKNGKRIFEGDVVKVDGFESWVNGFYIVEFKDVNHCWWLQNQYMFGKSFSFSDLNWFHEDCEVIGNIHDNPELMGGGGAK